MFKGVFQRLIRCLLFFVLATVFLNAVLQLCVSYFGRMTQSFNSFLPLYILFLFL